MPAIIRVVNGHPRIIIGGGAIEAAFIAQQAAMAFAEAVEDSADSASASAAAAAASAGSAVTSAESASDSADVASASASDASERASAAQSAASTASTKATEAAASAAQAIALVLPVASQPEAVAGEVNDKSMSPLRVRQAFDAIGVSSTALASTGAGMGASMVGFQGGGTVQDAIENRATKNLNNVTYDGSLTPITSAGGTQGAKRGENIVATNSATTGQYALRYAELRKTGVLGDGSNEIADALITRYSSITNGQVWNRWEVMITPLAPGSGLSGAPAAAQNFGMVMSELNPTNRYGNGGWESENRAMANRVCGYQWVPETQDFTGLLGNNRVGYHISFAQSYGKSPYASNFGTMANRHARFYNVSLINPNAIAPGGYETFATGWKNFPTAVAISAAGSGYAVGNLLTFNTGLSQVANQNTVVRVSSIGGGGAITGVEIWESGWYQQTFASPVGVTGGSGTGATFTYTLSTIAEQPRAVMGISGGWEYGIDGCPPPGDNSNTGFALFSGGMVRAPNNQNAMVARNAGDTADKVLLKLNTNDNVELDGKAVWPWADYIPTITAPSGAITVGSVLARYSRINGTIFLRVSFQVVTVTTPGTGLRVTLPTPAHASGFGTASATQISDSLVLSATLNPAQGVNLGTATGGFPGTAGKFYAFTAMYEAA